MINPTDIIFGVLKQLIPILLIIAAIKVAILFLREWNKPKRFRSTGFNADFQLNPADVVIDIPPKAKPPSLAAPSTPAEKLPYEQRKPLTATEAVSTIA